LLIAVISILDAAGKEIDAGDLSTATRVSTATDTRNVAMLEPSTINTEASQQNQQDHEGIALDESPSTAGNNLISNNDTALSTYIPTPAPPRQIEPGAVRVPGLDGQNADGNDDDSETNMTAASSCVDPENPVSAELVDEDEERRRIQEEIDREVAERERERVEREGQIPEAEIVIETEDENSIENSPCSTRVKILSVVAVVLLVIVAIVLGTVLPQLSEPEELTPGTVPPTPEDIALLSSVSFDNGAALQTPSTPQNNALLWLSNNANLDIYSDERKIQRYVLAVFYYSAAGSNWHNNIGWLSDGDECDWWHNFTDVSFCDENGAVVEFFFSDVNTDMGNNLVGTIPNELALLSDSVGEFCLVLLDCCVTKRKRSSHNLTLLFILQLCWC
jgi:hypothetical protein